MPAASRRGENSPTAARRASSISNCTTSAIPCRAGGRGALPLVRKLTDSGKNVFVDLKLHDIGNTVARGVESVAKLGATFLTVHAYPQTMKAAVEARAGSGLKILAGTRPAPSYD